MALAETEDAWRAYEDDAKQCPRQRRRKLRYGKVKLAPRVLA
jgi:hypothetical protein